eukprot:TRINITY_DN1547_c0_g1_i1.p1 TRINITY_DN1547_c0_g1~~TRINITY_DN1547_c0_g1_i1.p1  ORF type:complete len:343 (+),score=32.64 TRINITY_DN1547_c0_g1_i1:49-1077(+)
MAGLHGALQGRSVPCMQVEHDALNPGLFNHSQQLTGHISFHRNPVNLTLGCFGSERVSHIAFWNQKLLLEKTQRFRRKWKAAACQCYDPDCYSKVDSGHDQVISSSRLPNRRDVSLGIIGSCLSFSAFTELILPLSSAAQSLFTDTPLPLLETPCPSGTLISLAINGVCGLGVSLYPDFVYDPRGGGGEGTAIDVEDGNKIFVSFDPSSVLIPSVDSRSTTLLGLPIPPPLLISIIPKELEGFIDRSTGKVELHFRSEFRFSAGPLYRAPPLLVDTVLTTEISKGLTRQGTGSRLDSNGNCVLVGTARISPVNDAFLDKFLMLPTDVLAVLPSNFKLFPPPH